MIAKIQSDDTHLEEQKESRLVNKQGTRSTNCTTKKHKNNTTKETNGEYVNALITDHDVYNGKGLILASENPFSVLANDDIDETMMDDEDLVISVYKEIKDIVSNSDHNKVNIQNYSKQNKSKKT